jgi:hypothetical protein
MIAFAVPVQKVQAESKSSFIVSESFDLDGISFEVSEQFDTDLSKQKNPFYVGKLVRSENGSKEIIAKSVLHKLVTNKAVMYYTVCGKKKNTIYEYSIKTGKSKKILSKKCVGVFGRSGKYLYYGIYNDLYDYGNGLDMYAYNLKSKKSTHMKDHMGTMMYSGGKVLLMADKTDTSNSKVYLFNSNGKNGKKLVSALDSYIIKKHVYCIVCRYKKYSMQSKVVQYSLKGNNKKTVVNWTSDSSKLEKYKAETIILN